MTRRRPDRVRFGLYVPNFGKCSNPLTLAEMAVDAERSGWDGFFLWDHLVEWEKRLPLSDTLTTLSGVAMKTRRIRIGTALSPLPRYKPWDLARRTVTLDHMSNGRLVLSVGLGGVESCDYARFGEDEDNFVLAEKLDESLKIITGLWSGKKFSFRGKHYRVGPSVFLPTPKQRPRIPIWVGGFWPRHGPFKRAARWDGVLPLRLPEKLPEPKDLKEIVEFIQKHRSSSDSFDVANIGWTTGVNRKRDAEKVQKYVESGMTWWLESLYTKRDSPEAMRSRILTGPPKMVS
jgi:alkanesulfonate monooxygenase SsuD/methylene tetrahydromethanopterin reductase-like flavin-dependent oxidoreductase (luciferase family)